MKLSSTSCLSVPSFFFMLLHAFVFFLFLFSPTVYTKSNQISVKKNQKTALWVNGLHALCSHKTGHIGLSIPCSRKSREAQCVTRYGPFPESCLNQPAQDCLPGHLFQCLLEVRHFIAYLYSWQFYPFAVALAAARAFLIATF